MWRSPPPLWGRVGWGVRSEASRAALGSATPHPAPSKLASLTKTAQPSPTRGEGWAEVGRPSPLILDPEHQRHHPRLRDRPPILGRRAEAPVAQRLLTGDLPECV